MNQEGEENFAPKGAAVEHLKFSLRRLREIVRGISSHPHFSLFGGWNSVADPPAEIAQHVTALPKQIALSQISIFLEAENLESE